MRIIFALVLSIGLFGFPAFAESFSFTEIKTIPLKQVFGTTKDWHVTAYQPLGDDAAAKLCFWFEASKKQADCTSIISTLPHGGMTYHYQTVKELAVISTPHLVKFVAQFSGGGSGLLDQVSFWRYEKDTDVFIPAGRITLSEQSEYQLLGEGWLLTADAHLSEGETHFAPHRFAITAYQYAPSAGYEKRFSYLSPVKYPSLDDTDKIDVISREMPEIKKRLAGE